MCSLKFLELFPSDRKFSSADFLFGQFSIPPQSPIICNLSSGLPSSVGKKNQKSKQRKKMEIVRSVPDRMNNHFPFLIVEEEERVRLNPSS